MKFSKVLRRAAIGALAATLTLCAVGCGPKEPGPDSTDGGQFDNENDPLIFSIQETDGVFNPFFSTTGPDGEVVGMTQISMLTNDKDGNVAYGEDEAVVVLDYEETTEGTRQDVDLYTTYKFVLKNNIKFSDGKPLTIKDVLFNLYVYLDPAYYGSSTIYSTDIVGLKEYRTQERDENEQDSAASKFENEAEDRINNLIEAYTEIYDEVNNTDAYGEEEFNEKFDEYFEAHKDDTNTDRSHLKEDYDKAIEFFKEELESDYSQAVDSYSDIVFNSKNKPNLAYKPFTTDVEAFLYNEGYISWNASANNGDGELTSTLTNNVEDIKNYTKDEAIREVYDRVIPYHFDQVIEYWGTAQTLQQYLTTKAGEAYYANKTREIPNISGIQFANMDQQTSVNGKIYQKPEYNADGSVKDGFNEVLSIRIKNVDPKAIWNFALTIAPMHYYSDAEHVEKFDFVNNFGVEYYSRTFLDEVVNSEDKVGVPVGAGPYAASKSSGGVDYTQIGKGDFKQANIIYYERNPYYNMGDGENGVAKIKKIRYQVTPSAQMTNALYANQLHFITPNAKPETQEEINSKEGYKAKSVQTAGYGYIGINAGLVPSLKVRQAIMHSINVEEVVGYYKGTAKIIYRSMSLSSWAYPSNATAYYPYIGGPVPSNLNVVNPDYKDFVEEKNKKAGDIFSEDEQVEFIRRLVESDGYHLAGDGIYYNEKYTNKNGSNKLQYKFTIVGTEQDHPAYNALLQAGQFLSATVGGFAITTGLDQLGLSKLSTGDLAIWAAAWGSAIDPDMYQVYHKDSKATSVNAWGYPQILNKPNMYPTENRLLNTLKTYIDNGRKTTDQNARASIYSTALDYVMQLAIELPTYQRDDLFGWNDVRIDSSTFVPDSELSAYRGLTSEIQNVSLRVS